jgi:hypothetical protein
MRWPIPTILQLIGKGLNQQQAPVTAAALPARWVELINHLNNLESCERDASQTQRARRWRNAPQP